MTRREIPIDAIFGEVVEHAELTSIPGETRITFRSGRWLLCNLNTGTLKAYEGVSDSLSDKR